MVSSIFIHEVTALENQVAQLQNQITQAQERINQLGECEVTAAGAIQALQGAVNKIAGLAPDAIATLKASVLNLFNSGDGGNHVEQPVNPDGPSPIAPDGINREQHDVRRVVVCPEPLVAPAENMAETLRSSDGTEQLEGQHSELCCCWEDAPEEVLQGQSVEVSCWYAHIKPLTLTHKGDGYEQWSAPQAIAETPTNEQVSINKESDNAEAQDLFELVKVGNEVSYMRRIDRGEICCTYLGGNNKQTLKAWGEWLCINHSVGSKFELRGSQRLTQFKHEIKVWGMSLTQIQRLAESDTTKRPPSNYGTAPKREAFGVPSDLEISDYKPGDVVRSATVRNWSYTILAVTSDGLLEVERIGINPPIKSTLSPASVELIRRGGVVEVCLTGVS